MKPFTHASALAIGFLPGAAVNGFFVFYALMPKARAGHAVIQALRIMESNWQEPGRA